MHGSIKYKPEIMFQLCLLFLCWVTGFSANTCSFDVKLEQYLVNEGFHRNITYKIVFGSDVNRQYENCMVGLDQVLPAGVFANPDELGDLRRVQKLSAIPKNRVNIELPAEESHPTSVYIIAKVIDGQVNTWLPVHARYHRSAEDGGFASNEIEPARVYLRCPEQRLDQCNKEASTMTFLCSGSSKEKCTWREVPITVLTDTLVLKVPVGNTSVYALVTSVTASVVIIGSLYLLKTLHEYKIRNKKT